MSHDHRNAQTLRTLYQDLTRIDEFADPAIVLHKADRGAGGGLSMAIGRRAVRDHELNLVDKAHQTLQMEVHDIIADDHFGAVLGTLHATCEGQTIGMPFCGLWRFRDGKVVEHWENAYDARVLNGFLMGDESTAMRWISA
ncbi:nuclear transport factor 2 family protein [Pseudomonas sp. v388]|uniref:nuclear transport factor 2 family protein n=1 Tax=Pseudomonas sp. v388 TaxID=2479849 RepID=UPI000F79B11C|nr:nuclear transport factor 2 family protein [Pseudomonas sp. v388]RRV06300.1 nuclear transport factor 2 family protein [Pseudomonas sp. v388]